MFEITTSFKNFKNISFVNLLCTSKIIVHKDFVHQIHDQSLFDKCKDLLTHLVCS